MSKEMFAFGLLIGLALGAAFGFWINNRDWKEWAKTLPPFIGGTGRFTQIGNRFTFEKISIAEANAEGPRFQEGPFALPASAVAVLLRYGVVQVYEGGRLVGKSYPGNPSPKDEKDRPPEADNLYAGGAGGDFLRTIHFGREKRFSEQLTRMKERSR